MDHLYHGAAAGSNCSFPGAFGVTTPVAASATRINTNHYGSLESNNQTPGTDLSTSSLLGSTSRPNFTTPHPNHHLPNQYVSAAYAAAANFSIGAAAFLSCASGNGPQGSSVNTGMDTYPLTTHLHHSP